MKKYKNPLILNKSNIRRWAYINIPKYYYDPEEAARNFSKTFDYSLQSSLFFLSQDYEMKLYIDIYTKLIEKYGVGIKTNSLWQEIMIRNFENNFDYTRRGTIRFIGTIL